MIKFHLKRKITGLKLFIMTLVLSIPVLISCFSTLRFQRYWEGVLISKPPDVNLDSVQNTVDGYCGLTYYFNFLFSSDILVIFTIIFMIFVTYLVGNNVVEDLKSAYGNIIVTRVDYGKYFASNLVATFIFSFIYLFSFFTIMFFVSNIFGGSADFTSNFSSIYGLDKVDDNLLSFYGIAMFQMLQIFITSTLIVMLGTTFSVVIKNKYVLQMFPIIYFLASTIIAEILLGISEKVGLLLFPFGLVKRVNFLESNFFQNDEVKNILQMDYTSPMTFICIMGIAIIIIGGLNISKYRKDYL